MTGTSLNELFQFSESDVDKGVAEYPVLEISVSGMKLPVLRFTLELVAKFETVQLAISDARIRSMKPGEAGVIVRLKYGDATLKEVSTPKWKLPGWIAFGNGIPIPG